MSQCSKCGRLLAGECGLDTDTFEDGLCKDCRMKGNTCKKCGKMIAINCDMDPQIVRGLCRECRGVK